MEKVYYTEQKYMMFNFKDCDGEITTMLGSIEK